MNPYQIAHGAVGMIHPVARGTIFVHGADRASWLQGLLTNDIEALAVGRGCYAAWLTPQGRMLTDMRVFRLSERILLDVPALSATALAARLEQLVFAEDVRIENASEGFDPVRAVGPAAAAAVAAALNAVTSNKTMTGAELARWVEYQNAAFSVAQTDVIVMKDEGLGVPGYDIYSTMGSDLRNALVRAGAAPLDDATAETLRIEAGRPLFGVDMDTDTIPLEAGIEGRAISFSKGCYVGQEVIVRVVSRGHGRVVRKLVGLVLEGERVPDEGERLFANGRETGRVTSITRSPALGRPIALGYVHRDFAEPGRQVAVGAPAGETATVTPLPFVTFVP
jgi:folate-binding protein YgfZ